MEPEELESLGLNHNEAKVYPALLSLGESKSGQLVKRTGLHRVLIYDALNTLIQKGLASYVIKENIKYFSAADPERILDLLNEKQELAKTIVPKLRVLGVESKAKQQVSIYEGVKGLKSAMNNMIKELSPGGTHYVFASGNMAPAMGPYYDLYQLTKRKNKIRTIVIYDESFRNHSEIIERTSGDIKFYDLGPFLTDTWIYNDKVLIVNYLANPSVAILIQSKETAESYMNMFGGYWKKAKK